MFNLRTLTEQQRQVAEQRRRIALIRDRLLEPGTKFLLGTKFYLQPIHMSSIVLVEINELQRDLPRTCKVVWENKDKLQDFQLTVTPDEGDYRGGSFAFDIHVPEDYNIMVSYCFSSDFYVSVWKVKLYLHRALYITLLFVMQPPEVRCRTRIWHPNITEDGAVCLSLLRAHSIDGTGWSPTRNLKQVVFGINMLFNVSNRWFQLPESCDL